MGRESQEANGLTRRPQLASRSLHPSSITSALFFVRLNSFSSRLCCACRLGALKSGPERVLVSVMRKRRERLKGVLTRSGKEVASLPQYIEGSASARTRSDCIKEEIEDKMRKMLTWPCHEPHGETLRAPISFVTTRTVLRRLGLAASSMKYVSTSQYG
jgi:hypothetical protein